MNFRRPLCLLALSLCSFVCSLGATFPLACLLEGPHRVYIGPEVFYLERVKNNQSTQAGVLYGGRAGYDRIQRFSIYWGVEGHYSTGTIKGKAKRSGITLKSDMNEYEAEGRLGYTLQQEGGMRLSFTPFAGYGYHCQSNKFRSPTPLTIKSTERFSYTMLGFLSSITFSPSWEVAVRFKTKFMRDANNCISDDPDYDDVHIKIANRTQYNLDLPIHYTLCQWNRRIDIAIAPFYRFRHYGKKYDYPFDFTDTHIQSFGAHFELAYSF